MDQSADPSPMDQTDKSLDPSLRYKHICMVALHPTTFSPVRSKPSCLWQACFEVLAAAKFIGLHCPHIGPWLGRVGGNGRWFTFGLTWVCDPSLMFLAVAISPQTHARTTQIVLNKYKIVQTECWTIGVGSPFWLHDAGICAVLGQLQLCETCWKEMAVLGCPG